MAWDAHGAEVKRVVREHQAASRQRKDDNDTPSLDSDVQLLIQNMVRHRVKAEAQLAFCSSVRVPDQQRRNSQPSVEGWRMGRLLISRSR